MVAIIGKGQDRGLRVVVNGLFLDLQGGYVHFVIIQGAIILFVMK